MNGVAWKAEVDLSMPSEEWTWMEKCWDSTAERFDHELLEALKILSTLSDSTPINRRKLNEVHKL